MVSKEKRTLAEGEATGHAHVLQHTEVVRETSTLRTFLVLVPETVTHEEHKHIDLPENRYDSGQALEYDHFEEESKQVVD